MKNNDPSLTIRKKFPLYCSFCGKTEHEVLYLITGPTVFICNECVEVCREIGAQMVIDKALAAAPKTKKAPGGATA